MEAGRDRGCGALENLFQGVMSDMKTSYPVWEDFVSKAIKLHSQLRTTAVVVTAFLDAFQKIADLATGARGATREIGSSLTRMCLRHRSLESKLRLVSTALTDSLIGPLQEKLEDWKKSASQLDKDHAKDYKRVRQEIKKKSSDTLKLQKKVRKDTVGKGEMQPALDSALQQVSGSYQLLEDTQTQAVRRVLSEERARFCCFFSMLRPVLEGEVSMLEEVTHVQSIVVDLVTLTSDPQHLPPTSEQVILDLKGAEFSGGSQSPPSSPGPPSPRRGSLASYSTANGRLSLPLTPDGETLVTDGRFSQSSNIKEWSRPNPYDHGGTCTLPRHWEGTTVEGGATSSAGIRPAVDSSRPHSVALPPSTKVEEMGPRELGQSLVCMDSQKRSHDSLQCSSGYSTQTTTPTCSEDTISSQASESETLPRSKPSEAESTLRVAQTQIARTGRRGPSTRRPASTVGLTTAAAHGAGAPHGLATIRRVPTVPTRRPTSCVLSIPAPSPIPSPIPVYMPSIPATAVNSHCCDPAGGPVVSASTPSHPPVIVTPAERAQIAANRRSVTEKLGSLGGALAGPPPPTYSPARTGATELHWSPPASPLSPHALPSQDMLTAIRRDGRIHGIGM
uniref:IMD domain-containing protein n=1 Tax=Eptatretus burgeri TaxID=7764 RepID=A0A8C4R8Q8_EPTBU